MTGAVCSLCARRLRPRPGAGEAFTGHAEWCPSALQPDSGSPDWRDGYRAGFDAARQHLIPELLALWRRQLGGILATTRDGFTGAARVAPDVVLDVIERAAERIGLL